ncbi:MAG: sterol desaturase family protein [Deltaproteobacteria bacterium]|nr:sterol desaturase family protein [Deltaproteobacteria bacterium]
MDIDTLLSRFLVFARSPEGTSLSIIGISAVIYITLERFFPYSPQQKFFRKGWWTDFFWYTLIQSYFLGVLITAFIQWFDTSTGLSRLRLVSDWPVWVQLLFFFVVHDFYIYWFHRWQHSNKWLWRTHEAHHSVEDVDWVAGSRSHAVEIAINQTIEFLPIFVLGAAPVVRLYKGVIDAVWGMYIHANINVRTGWLQRIINGPEMHRWHHAKEVVDINFSTKLAIWDWIFGTAHLPAKKPQGYGLTDVEFPRNYFVQQLFAFRRFAPSRQTTHPRESPLEGR